MIRIIIIIAFFLASENIWALDQCSLYNRYIEIADEKGFKAYEVPEEIYLSGAKCYESKGDNATANKMSSYAAMFGAPFAQVEYMWRAFSNGVDESVLVTLSAMSQSSNENTSFNSKLLLGLYYSTAKTLPSIPHLTLEQLREYGINLLVDASNSEYGFSAFYALAAIYKKAGNQDWKIKLSAGNESQRKHVGKIQRTCSSVVEQLTSLYETDNSLISDHCDG